MYKLKITYYLLDINFDSKNGNISHFVTKEKKFASYFEKYYVSIIQLLYDFTIL